jgi:hypothetical protein
MAPPNARAWLRAAVISLVLSAVVTLSASIIFGGGASYIPPVEWDKVEKMTYGEAVAYINERAQTMSGWEAFRNGVPTWWFWRQLLQGWALLFVFGFLCCSAAILWGGIRAAPSNNTVDSDARKSGARGSP